MKIILRAIALATILISPAQADSIDAQKAEAIRQMTQETLPMGGGKFLLIDGGPGVYENVYGFDMIKVVDGVPKREPLFMQEFDAETRGMSLSDAVAISAMSYAFDKKDNILTYTSRSADGSMRYRYKYTLAGDMFVLDEVMGQDYCADASCKSKPPQTLFRSADAAPAPTAAAPAAGMPEKSLTPKPAEQPPAAKLEIKPEPEKITAPDAKKN
jgi:hypothetical protein